jgi:putative PIN family toxin of toxin-antitoxin system
MDANIWISYAITDNLYKISDITAESKISIFICDELIDELKRVLTYPHLRKYNINISGFIRFVKDISVHHNLEYPIKDYIPGDANDNYIVALALQTGSGFITSGDRHILSQKAILQAKFKKLKILTKAEFEKMFHI